MTDKGPSPAHTDWADKHGVSVFIGQDGAELYQLIAQKHAVMLEMKGLRFKGGSVSAHCRKKHNIPGRTKREVLDWLVEEIEKKGEEYLRKHKPRRG